MIFTASKLRKDYGPHAPRVLDGFLKELPRKKKEQQKYEAAKPLPSKDEFCKLRDAAFMTTIDALINDAVSELESLRDELQGWFDNLPESFQQGDKGSQLEEAISQLDNVQTPDIPEGPGNVKTVYVPGEKVSSRRDRCDEACGMLQTAIDDLQSELDDIEDNEANAEKREEIESLIQEVEEIKGNAENVEFPGMY